MTTKIPPELVGYQIGRRNLIINGDMRVAQRGTSSTSANYQTVDRWRNGFGGVTLTQSQQALTSGSPYDEGFRNFLRLTQSGSSAAASDFVQISQRIEGLTAATSGWNYKSTSSKVTISFWVRSSLAGTYYIYMNTRSSTGDGYINAPFTLTANTWTKVTQSFSGNASNVNIDNDNTSGIELRIVPYYGTNYTGGSVSSNAWYFGTGSGELPNFAQNWTASSGATFDLTGVQLEVGSQATPFEYRSFGEELALCHRYYELFFYGATAAHLGNHSYGNWSLIQPKRAQPSVSLSGTMTYFLANASTGTGATVTTATFKNASCPIRAYVYNVHLELFEGFIIADAEL